MVVLILLKILTSIEYQETIMKQDMTLFVCSHHTSKNYDTVVHIQNDHICLAGTAEEPSGGNSLSQTLASIAAIILLNKVCT